LWFRHQLKNGVDLRVPRINPQGLATGIYKVVFTHPTKNQGVWIMAVLALHQHELIAHRVRGTTDFAH
jgi:hypothetical protein